MGIPLARQVVRDRITGLHLKEFGCGIVYWK
jgi:hypothetical protein